MANEASVSASLAYANATALIGSQSLSVTSGITFDVTAVGYKKMSMLVPVASTNGIAIDLTGIVTIGWLFIKNLSPVNYVQVMTATSGTVFARLLPNSGPILIYIDPTITAPALKAHTADCEVEILALPI